MTRVRVNIKGRWYTVEVGDPRRNPVEVVVDGERYLVEMEPTSVAARQSTGTAAATSKAPEQRQAPGLRGITSGDERTIRSPLPGRIVSVSVRVGQRVQGGDEICILESMKMEQSVRMGRDGKVKTVQIAVGQSVQTGSPLVELE